VPSPSANDGSGAVRVVEVPVEGGVVVVVVVAGGCVVPVVAGAAVVVDVVPPGGALEIVTVLVCEPQPASSAAPRTAIVVSRRIGLMVGTRRRDGCTSPPGGGAGTIEAMATQPPQEKQAKAQPQKRSNRELVRTGLMVVLAVYFTLFAVLNLSDVNVDWVFGSGKAPLIIVIVVSLLVGIVLTYFVERRSKRKS
jgi:uncharacterized integral membrane protein